LSAARGETRHAKPALLRSFIEGSASDIASCSISYLCSNASAKLWWVVSPAKLWWVVV